MSCDVGKAAEVLDNELWRRWSDVRVGEWGGAYVTAHYLTLPPLCLRHSSFYSPYVASPTSQLILQSLHRFTYITAHSTTLPLLHLRHRTFYNSSVASPTSQVFHVLHLANRPCIGGWKNSLWWTSLLQQVTKFRSSYSFWIVVMNFSTSSKLILL